jgi:hypothetical protein
MIALAFGVGAGLGIAQTFEQRYGLELWIADGLEGVLLGLVLGLLIGLSMSGTCWPRFAMASLWLWVRRRLPLCLMGFLNDAYRLGLLRIVGPVYQFRHAALQDHLAPPAKSITTTASPATPLRCSGQGSADIDTHLSHGTVQS